MILFFKTATVLFFAFVSSSSLQNNNVKVLVSNIPAQKGSLMVGWYNQSATFRQPQSAIYKQKVKTNGAVAVEVLFANIPNGEYAITMYFDANENGKLDKNFLGIPLEKYGFSNNAYHSTRATTFEEAKFVVKQNNQSIAIGLK